ncbi:transporter substrate-binding domain-containing protein [Chitinibacter bivalviorum]|uniref:Transporter substrate-binding domain-containing protein n=1 Tax=Chitinibacter bivalviorum TaxID=2739434 RepID=A0A7H9BMD1_9NEIS|nr:transporter substrate-binding domain-containing protein [Chitinibacter bivalviorum]QLG89556.1 transporter substrate-binding domain-containing protein [Chitinibacter bivalviorum]
MIRFLLALLLAMPCWAQKVVTIGTGYVLPPYVIPETASGYELDIVRAAFQARGIDVKFSFLPPARALYSAKIKALDAVTTVNENSGATGYWSESHISYQNYAITLKSRQFNIQHVEDLAGHTVSAFQNARISLGPQYALAINLATYQEYPDQLTQNKLLYSQRTDVVIADRLIFEYLNPQIADKFDTKQPLSFHAIFPPTEYKVLFNDAKLRDQFNQGLAQIKANGTYRRIKERYLPNDK